MKIFLLSILWSLWFLNFSSRTVFSPLLPIIEEELSLTHALAGGLFVFLSVGYTAALFLAGFLSPRLGYKRTIVAGFVVLTTALFFLQWAHSYWALAGFILVIGLGAGIFLPSVIPILTAVFEARKWGRTIALFDTASSLSIFAVPILVAIALPHFTWRALFPMLSLACLAGLVVFWAFAPDPRPQEGERSRFLDVVGRREFWILTALWTLSTATNIGLYNVIPLFLVQERELSLEVANGLVGISRVSGPFVSVLSGFLADRYGARRVLRFGFLISGIATIGLALAPSLGLLVAMLIVQAASALVFFPIGFVLISKLSTLEERSIFTGAALALAVIVGMGLTPFALGATADAWNFQTGILALGVLTVLAPLSLRGLQEI